jgi:AP2 domain
MKFIQLTKGYAAIVDDADYEAVVAAEPWYANVRHDNTVYAVHVVRIGSRRRMEYLHRFILGMTDPKILVDHRNRYKLDCRRGNLRVGITRSQNMANSNNKRGGTSRYKGVQWDKRHSKWVAKIRVNYKVKQLGLFAIEVDAARAYDAAAREHFGEFAKCNLGLRGPTR